jgi:hypothetical protein
VDSFELAVSGGNSFNQFVQARDGLHGADPVSHGRWHFGPDGGVLPPGNGWMWCSRNLPGLSLVVALGYGDTPRTGLRASSSTCRTSVRVSGASGFHSPDSRVGDRLLDALVHPLSGGPTGAAFVVFHPFPS